MQRRGGGHAFAKRPRDFGYRLPRKALQLATRMAIASKIEDQQLVIINELNLSAPKTKQMAGILKALKLEGNSLLVATDQYDVNVYKSARNLPSVSVSYAGELNALSVLTPRLLLVTKSALDKLKQQSAGSSAEPATTGATA